MDRCPSSLPVAVCVLMGSFLCNLIHVSYGQTSQELAPQTLLHGGLNDVVALCFSKSGNQLAAVDSEGLLAIWQVDQKKLIGKVQFSDGMGDLPCLEWDADGTKLLIWSHKVGAFVIDPRSMKQTTIFSKSKGLQGTIPYRYRSTQDLRLSPDGKSLLRVQSPLIDVTDEVQASDSVPSYLEEINIETEKVLSLDAPRYIMCVEYYQNGQFLLTDLDATLLKGDLNPGSQKTQVLRKTSKKRQELYDNITIIYRGILGLSADQKYAVVSGVSGEFKYDESGEVKNSISGVVDVFQLDPLEKIKTLPITKINFEDQRISNIFSQLNTVCISPDSSYIAAGSLSGIIQIWNRKNMQTVRVKNLKYEDTPRDIHFAPGRQPLCAFIAGHENSFYLFDLNKKRDFKLSAVQTFDWSADGKQLAVGGGEDGAVLIFHMEE